MFSKYLYESLLGELT